MIDRPVYSQSQYHRFGERDYLNLCYKTAGTAVDFDKWNEAQVQRRLLQQVSREVADRLESVGFEARTGRDMSIVGLQSRGILKLESYRDLRIIPEVARRKRRALLKDVEYWMAQRPFARMWTFTTGERCMIWELRERLKWLHRKVSKLNATKFMKKAGASIVFRASELGEIKASEVGGQFSFHPHAHCLVDLRAKLSKTAWATLLSQVSEWWGPHWDESGKVCQPRELVKYLAKPFDLLKLNGSQLLELNEITGTSRMVEGLGSLRSERSARNKAKERVDCINGRWVTSKRWNSHAKTASPLSVEELALMNVEKKDTRPTARLPRVLARCLPSPVFSPVREPIFLVEDLGDRSADCIVDSAEARWVLDSIRVHTTSVTVPWKMEEKRVKEQDLVYETANPY